LASVRPTPPSRPPSPLPVSNRISSLPVLIKRRREGELHLVDRQIVVLQQRLNLFLRGIGAKDRLRFRHQPVAIGEDGDLVVAQLETLEGGRHGRGHRHFGLGGAGHQHRRRQRGSAGQLEQRSSGQAHLFSPWWMDRQKMARRRGRASVFTTIVIDEAFTDEKPFRAGTGNTERLPSPPPTP
jgi:hypothetical protein